MTERPGASPDDPHELLHEREQEVDEMERRSRDLGSDLSDARDDWARKRSDPGVPGAAPPAEESGSDSNTD